MINMVCDSASPDVVDQSQKTNERLNLPVSKAEFAVMRTAFSVRLALLLYFINLHMRKTN